MTYCDCNSRVQSINNILLLLLFTLFNDFSLFDIIIMTFDRDNLVDCIKLRCAETTTSLDACPTQVFKTYPLILTVIRFYNFKRKNIYILLNIGIYFGFTVPSHEPVRMVIFSCLVNNLLYHLNFLFYFRIK